MTTEIEILNKEKELKEILETMILPVERIILPVEHTIMAVSIRQSNLLWLLRNMGIKNSTHSKFDKAMASIKTLLTQN